MKFGLAIKLVEQPCYCPTVMLRKPNYADGCRPEL